MQTGEDIAEALRNVADYIEQRDTGSVILDVNGNTVGNFRYREQDAEREAKAVVKSAFTFIDGERFRDADVEEQSAVFIADVIADVIKAERGVVR